MSQAGIVKNESGSAVLTIDADSGSATPNSGVITISGGTTGLTTVASGSTLDLTGTLDVSNGGTGINTLAANSVPFGNGTAPFGSIGFSSTTARGNNLMSRDASGNTAVNSIAIGTTNTASSGGTITMGIYSAQYQILTGIDNETYVLPDATTLTNGWQFYFNNESTGTLAVQFHDTSLFFPMVPGSFAVIFLRDNTTSNGLWSHKWLMPADAQYGTAGLTVTGTIVATTSVTSPDLQVTGSSSGTISILGQAAAGTYNFNLPITAGTAGQALLSGDGIGAPMTFGSLGPGGGGTGVSNPTAHTLPVAEGSSAFNFLGPLTNGQLLIGSTSADPVAAAPTGVANGGILINTGAGTLSFQLNTGFGLSNFQFFNNSNGTTRNVSIINNGTSSTDAAFLEIETQSGAGNPYTFYNIFGVQSWATGLDGGASGAFKISNSSNVGTNDCVIINPSGYMTRPKQPLASVYLATSVTNVTGDGTNYKILFDTAVLNISSSYATGTGNFTAPVAGNYLITGSVGLGSLGVAHTAGIISIQTTAKNYQTSAMNYGVVKDANSNLVLPFSIIVPMSLNDIASIAVSVSNSTKSVSVLGTATPLSFFDVFLLS